MTTDPPTKQFKEPPYDPKEDVKRNVTIFRICLFIMLNLFVLLNIFMLLLIHAGKIEIGFGAISFVAALIIFGRWYDLYMS